MNPMVLMLQGADLLYSLVLTCTCTREREEREREREKCVYLDARDIKKQQNMRGLDVNKQCCE